jgi:hypothetical protein
VRATACVRRSGCSSSPVRDRLAPFVHMRCVNRLRSEALATRKGNSIARSGVSFQSSIELFACRLFLKGFALLFASVLLFLRCLHVCAVSSLNVAVSLTNHDETQPVPTIPKGHSFRMRTGQVLHYVWLAGLGLLVLWIAAVIVYDRLSMLKRCHFAKDWKNACNALCDVALLVTVRPVCFIAPTF